MQAKVIWIMIGMLLLDVRLLIRLSAAKLIDNRPKNKFPGAIINSPAKPSPVIPQKR